jgi:hypothetical protein
MSNITSTWSLDQVDSDLRETIEEQFAKVLQEEIDREVMSDLEDQIYKDRGWILSRYDEKYEHHDLDKIVLWVETNAQGEWKMAAHQCVVYFEREADASHFILKWS